MTNMGDDLNLLLAHSRTVPKAKVLCESGVAPAAEVRLRSVRNIENGEKGAFGTEPVLATGGGTTRDSHPSGM